MSGTLGYDHLRAAAVRQVAQQVAAAIRLVGLLPSW